MSGPPLTPIERYFVHDHRESHPAWIRYDLTFRGGFDRAAFERAWAEIPTLHPLTGATVARRRWGRPVWRLGVARPELSWGGAEAPATAARDRHDLSTRAGLRGEVCAGGGETRLTLHVHHAVADGLGLWLIAEDLLVLYAAELGATIARPTGAPIDPRRDGLWSGGWGALRRWPWVMLGACWGLLLGRQRRVEARGTGAGGRGGEPLVWTCGEEDTARLRAAARAAGATLNELLTRDVQAALGAWLERLGPPMPEDWTRLLVPVNLGGVRSDSRNSANALGVAPIDRRVRSLGRRARLLQRAREDMAFIRQRGLERSFALGLGVRGLIPGGIARHCRRSGARSTLVFSNLGRIFGSGPLVRADGILAVPGAELEGVFGAGPCRPGTNLFVLSGEYRGRRSFWVSYDPAALGATEAADFVAELAAQVRRSMAGEAG